MDRRNFLKLALATSLASKIGPGFAADARGEIPRRALGKTGERVSIVGLGGFHLGKASSDDEAVRIVRTAVDQGVNFMDNCWDYNDGLSETRLGKALADGYRDKVFLMTKIDGRDRKTATAQLDESLRRLRVDHLDLLQIHEVIRMDDPDRVFAAGGAIEALAAAKQAGKIRYIGFTGHKSPTIHLKMLKTADDHGFHFDTVQMPLNVMDAHTEGFEKRVLPVLLRKKIGVLGMKPIGSGVIIESKTVEAADCLRYAMSLPTSVVITGCDSMKILEQALAVARGFRPLDPSARASLLAKTAAVASQGGYELYKTSERFDATSEHPQWLG
jgi:aryl-alcohol dehydrogenase-like predicted oxidoreductase